MNQQSTKLKYILMGGYIISRVDRDWYYVSAKQLLHLYNLKEEECLLVDQGETYKMLGIKPYEYTCLQPRYDGNYNLKEDE